MQFTKEQIAKAKQTTSAKELLAIAKENGVELTEEQAKTYFAELHKEGELSDEELAAVVGGKEQVYGTTRFNSGDIVQDKAGVQYEIIRWDSDVYNRYDGSLMFVWFLAIVKYVPESAKAYTGLREGDEHYVHSAIVSRI